MGEEIEEEEKILLNFFFFERDITVKRVFRLRSK